MIIAPNVIAAEYEPSPDDRVRVFIKYADSWRPIMWLKVGRDGSAYIAPRMRTVTTLRRGSKRLEGGSVHISYQDGEEIAEADLMRAPKISFHASGIVTAPRERMRRETPLRELTKQEQLCNLLFQHPSSYSPDSNVGDRDILVDYPIDEHRPLQAYVFASPTSGTSLPSLSQARHQVSLVLPFRDLRNCQNLTFQVVLTHGLTGAWPPLTYIGFWGISQPGVPHGS